MNNFWIKAVVVCCGFALGWCAPAVAVEPSGIEIEPHIIDEQANARDIFNYQIKVKNNTANQADIYLLVNDISFVAGKQQTLDPALLDKSNSLSRWISITRGKIELASGEEKQIPLNIKVNMSAAPGVYYAAITFSPNSSRSGAEEAAKKYNLPQLIISFEVGDQILEKSQLSNFKSLKNVYFNFPAQFSLSIMNVGNTPIKPQGAIHIYNRKGEEVDTLDINPEKKSIVAETEGIYLIDWQGKSFGKFKARLEAEYGIKEKRDLQDTVYFYVFPWMFLAIFIVAAFVLIIILTLFINRFQQKQVFEQEIVDHRSIKPTEQKNINNSAVQQNSVKPQPTQPMMPTENLNLKLVIDLRHGNKK